MGRWVLLVVALLPAGAWAQSWTGTGSAEYVLVHKFHEVVGRCQKTEGRAVSDENGIKVMARAQVACFDSGNTNRDTNAMETVDAAHHPLVIVKGVASGAKLPAPGQQAKVPVEARVELKGVERPQTIEVLFDRKDENTLEASFAFPVSLTAYGIKRPSLLFVPVEDEVQIRGKFALKVQP